MTKNRMRGDWWWWDTGVRVGDWWDQDDMCSVRHMDVEDDHVGRPRQTGVLDQNGRMLYHAPVPVGFHYSRKAKN